MNLLNLDDIQARSIGFNIDRYRWLTGLLAVFLASATVAIVLGQLAFLGIIVPHVVRKLVGGNYRATYLFSTVIGAWLLLVADLLGRVIQPPLEIPANAILMIVGGPMLIYLICQSQTKSNPKTRTTGLVMTEETSLIKEDFYENEAIFNY